MIENVDQARILCEKLAKKGLHFICPHTNSAFMDDWGTYEHWCSMYHNILLRCDALLTFGQWRKSQGTLAEIELAQLNQIPVFHKLHEVSRWVKEHV